MALLLRRYWDLEFVCSTSQLTQHGDDILQERIETILGFNDHSKNCNMNNIVFSNQVGWQ